MTDMVRDLLEMSAFGKWSQNRAVILLVCPAQNDSRHLDLSKTGAHGSKQNWVLEGPWVLKKTPMHHSLPIEPLWEAAWASLG